MTLIDFSVDSVVSLGYKSHWGLETSVFTRQTKDYDQSDEAEDIDGNTWGSAVEDMLPGPRKIHSKINGMHSGVRGQIGNILRPYIGRTEPVRMWAAHETLDALAPCEFQPCRVKKYGITAKYKEAVQFETDVNAAGDFNNGFILVSPKGNTQMATTGTGSVDINAAATTFGGVAQLHMFDVSGGTTPSVTVLVQHSPDGTTWTTLASFTAVTNTTILTPTIAVQRVKIPSTTTVNAQVRASWTTTGTPTSVQGLVMFGRGVDPDA